MTEKIHYVLDGYREFALVDILDENGEPTNDKKFRIKLDGHGIIKGKETEIQIDFNMLKIDGQLLLEDLMRCLK